MGNRTAKSSSNCGHEFHILDLPSPILYEILTYLDRKALVTISRTCTAFKSLAYSSTFWMFAVVELTAKSSRMMKSDAIMKSLSERKVSTIKLSDTHNQYETKSKKKIKMISSRQVERSLQACQDNIRENIKTVLCAVGPQAIIDISLLAGFTSLSTLILIYTMDRSNYSETNLKFSQVLAKLVKVEKLVWLPGIDACTNLSWTEQTRVIESDFSSNDYLTEITTCLPRLKDLTIGKMFWDYYALHEIQVAGLPYNTEPPTEPLIVAENVERLSFAEGLLGKLGLHHAPKMFPNVRHLVLRHPRENSYQYNIKPDDIKSLLDSFQYLESLELGDFGRLEDDTVPLIPPNVKALRLCGCFGDGLTSTMNISTLISRSMESLSLLEISVPNLLQPETYFGDHEVEDRSKIVPNLCQAIRMLDNLEILILTRRHYLYSMNEDFYYCIQEQAKSLVSVIGVDFPNPELLPIRLRYITFKDVAADDLHHQYTIQRSQSDPNKWIGVEENSRAWHEAHGTAYFHPDGQFSPAHDTIENFVRHESLSRNRYFIRRYAQTSDFPRLHDYQMHGHIH